jgi:hypothetical protein
MSSGVKFEDRYDGQGDTALFSRISANEGIAAAAHLMRERDAAAHLEMLKDVSLRLMAEQERLADVLPPRLKHFLAQASYSKALDWISEQE